MRSSVSDARTGVLLPTKAATAATSANEYLTLMILPAFCCYIFGLKARYVMGWTIAMGQNPTADGWKVSPEYGCSIHGVNAPVGRVGFYPMDGLRQ